MVAERQLLLSTIFRKCHGYRFAVISLNSWRQCEFRTRRVYIACNTTEREKKNKGRNRMDVSGGRSEDICRCACTADNARCIATTRNMAMHARHVEHVTIDGFQIELWPIHGSTMTSYLSFSLFSPPRERGLSFSLSISLSLSLSLSPTTQCVSLMILHWTPCTYETQWIRLAGNSFSSALLNV